jgi:hypothetical protein
MCICIYHWVQKLSKSFNEGIRKPSFELIIIMDKSSGISNFEPELVRTGFEIIESRIYLL